MNEQTKQAETPKPPKRAYTTPKVIELGDVRELTQSGGGTVADNPVTSTRGSHN
jgi:hypothetical protein